MYINGTVIASMRKEIGMSQHDLAEHLAIDTELLNRYEKGDVVWFEEDLFRLITLQTIIEDSSYMLDGEYAQDFLEINREYGL